MSDDAQHLPAVVSGDGGQLPLTIVGDRIKYVDEMKKDIMKSGRDYDTIPGTKKPTLLKPGAEKLAFAFMLAPIYLTPGESIDYHKEWQYEVDIIEYPGGKRTVIDRETRTTIGFYAYRVSCELRHKETGQIWCIAEGECNSRERGREASPANTILKMAQKRAFVAATLNATFSSELFTQDMEDLPRGGKGSQPAAAQTNADGDVVWPVGKKFKGTPIKDIPHDYLEWVINNMKQPEFINLAKTELDRRGNLAKDPGEPGSADGDNKAGSTPDQELIEAIEKAEIIRWGTDTEAIGENRLANGGTFDLMQMSPIQLKNVQQSINK